MDMWKKEKHSLDEAFIIDGSLIKNQDRPFNPKDLK